MQYPEERLPDDVRERRKLEALSDRQLMPQLNHADPEIAMLAKLVAYDRLVKVAEVKPLPRLMAARPPLPPAVQSPAPLSAEELRQGLETNFKGLDTDTLQGLAAGAVRSLANQAKATLYDRIREEWDDKR